MKERKEDKPEGRKKTLTVRWAVKKVKNTARVNMMYCFSACSVNQN